jgi:hypothetical protein
MRERDDRVDPMKLLAHYNVAALNFKFIYNYNNYHYLTTSAGQNIYRPNISV